MTTPNKKYVLVEDGNAYATIEAVDLAAAFAIAKANFAGNQDPYPEHLADSNKTVGYVEVRVYEVDANGDRIDDPEVEAEMSENCEVSLPDPKCLEDRVEHDWIEDSVKGHGGGVVIEEHCRYCALRKTTSTWDSITNQADDSVSYDRSSYKK